jgi:hypothetical protein
MGRRAARPCQEVAAAHGSDWARILTTTPSSDLSAPMKVIIPDTVLSTDLQNECVLLNLETGEYFGLDQVGMDMFKALGTAGTIEAARDALLERYEVTAEVLTRDLEDLVARLVEHKLVQVSDD